jgi:threonine dehydratase
MAGLNCGTPSTLGFDILKNTADLFLAVDDYFAKWAMKLLH